MKKTWMIIFALLLSVLLLGCAGAEEEGEEYIGTFVSEEPSYCPDCDIDVYTGKYSLHWHTWFCPQCGEATPNDTDTHYRASCDAPDTCLTCGASGVEVEWIDCNWNEQILHTDTQHWVICADCGEYLEYPFAHWSYCDAPTVCAVCGETDCIITADNILHSNKTGYEIRYDKTSHWYYCPSCGEDNIAHRSHSHYCDETICRDCKQENVTFGAVQHVDVDYTWVKMNDTYCGRKCTECGGFESYFRPHTASCTAPDVCTRCKSVGIVAEYVHDSDLAYDADYHWYECADCGNISNKERHEADCDAPDECFNCYQTGVNAEIVGHGYWTWDFVTKHNATHCWSECPGCGEKFDETRHFTGDCTVPNTCEWCGTDGVDCILYHSYEAIDESGGHYYVAAAEYDENGHWWTCEDCGKKTKYDHEVNASNLCVACGYQPAEPCEHPASSWRYEFAGEYEHIAFCGDCGVQMVFDTTYGSDIYERHSDVCSNAGVCSVCGAENVSVLDTVHSTKTKIYHDTTMHWQGCADCEEILDLRTMKKHTYKDYVCTECGYTPFTDILGTFTYADDAAWCSDCERDVYTGVYTQTKCWFACPECCKTIHEFGLHYANCDKPDTCYNCGAAGVIFSKVCHEDGAIKYDDKQHWGECSRCGEKIEAADHVLADMWDDYEHWTACGECGYEPEARAEHTAVCNALNVCSTCGQSDVTISQVEHETGELIYNDVQHWLACSRCGEEIDIVDHTWTILWDDAEHWMGCSECKYVQDERAAHAAACDMKDICRTCGQSDVTISQIDHFTGASAYDDTQHWRTCERCDEKVEATAHTLKFQWDDNGHWQYCSECKYVQEEHTAHTSEIKFNEDYHWNGCTDCEYIKSDAFFNQHRFRENVWISATECGKKCWYCDAVNPETEPHEATCTAPGVCVNCKGTDIIVEELEHNFNWEKHEKVSDTQCAAVCDDCGDLSPDYYLHVAQCTEPDTCYYCGATDVTMGEIECEEFKETYDDYAHWGVCVNCGKSNGYYEYHHAECSAPDICYICEATGVYCEIDDHDDPERDYDEHYHWRVCQVCGAKTWYEKHERDCTDEPGICRLCDVAVDDADMIIEHSYYTDWISIDATQHQPVCRDCGEPVGEPVDHVANCNNPTHCTLCGADDVTAVFSHEIDYAEDPVYDNTHHWYACTICGEPAEKERHYNWNDCTVENVCSYCDAENVDSIMYHTYDNFDMGEHTKDGHTFSNEKGHWWHCNLCGDETIHPHEFGNGSYCEICQFAKKDARTPGDANEDGSVTLEDIKLILAYFADSSVEINLGNANVTDDDAVDMNDVLVLMQYTAGWDIELE